MKKHNPVLGTAQFGEAYGITNGKIMSRGEIDGILRNAYLNGITTLDTAPSYGNSESIIEEFTSHSFRISTKVSFKDLITNKIQDIEKNLEIKFGTHLPINCLIHDWPQLKNSEKNEIYLKIMQNSKLKWGPSIYDLEEALEILEKYQGFKCIQFPTSILDQRFLPLFSDFQSKSIEIWVRSIFLQGLISEDFSNTKFSTHPDVNRIIRFCTINNVSPIHLAINFVNLLDVDYFIFGVASGAQLEQIINYMQRPVSISNLEEFASRDTNLIDPRKW